jgi:Pectate lyase superfamily protein
MAVVQISKIQVRKGQKLQTGIPQLSGGEFAWAVDTQELYIGNGSVAEGSPAVGNTKILTEFDNILELTRGYRFAEGSPEIRRSQGRTLQSKLDEYVSIRDYGATGDGSSDNTAAIQRALDDLFLNENVEFRKILFFPNGTYLCLSNLLIPSNAIIAGESNNNTVLLINNNIVSTKTINNTTLGSFSASDRPENIKISNLKFRFSTGLIDLTGARDVQFKNTVFEGPYTLGATGSNSLVAWSNQNEGTKVTNVLFEQCEFVKGYVGVSSISVSAVDTVVQFDRCEFNLCGQGIYITGILNQQNAWVVRNCSFDLIFSQAIYTNNGTGFLVDGSKFTKCGNGLNDSATPLFPVVEFGQPQNNNVIDSFFDRIQDASVTTSFLKLASPEVLRGAKTTISNNVIADIAPSDGQRTLAVFSALNRYMTIDYMLTLDSYVRRGKITMVMNVDISATRFQGTYDNNATYAKNDSVTFLANTYVALQATTGIPPTGAGTSALFWLLVSVSITDDYLYVPSTQIGANIMNNFEFGFNLLNNDSNTGVETLQLWYRNPLVTGLNGFIAYYVSYGV